ncbi:hypothetical protein JL720_15487 [Aureococcus anophagefferens]|nr:hypothetical protein JL720_15487 [Aureococcus anophagefferens]
MRPFLGRRRALLALLTFAVASGWAPQHSAAKHPRRLLGVRGVEAPNPPTSKARRTRARPPMLTQWTAPRGSAAEGADGGYLETLTKKVQQSLPRTRSRSRPQRCFGRRAGARRALAELKLAVDYDPGHGASWVAMARLLTRDVRDAPLPLDGRDRRRRAAATRTGRGRQLELAARPAARRPRARRARRCYAKALEAQPRSYFALSAFGDLEARLGASKRAPS